MYQDTQINEYYKSSANWKEERECGAAKLYAEETATRCGKEAVIGLSDPINRIAETLTEQFTPEQIVKILEGVKQKVIAVWMGRVEGAKKQYEELAKQADPLFNAKN